MGNWLNIQKVKEVFELDTPALIIFLILLSYFFYRIFLKEVSPERHKNLRWHFKTLLYYLFPALIFYGISWVLLNNCEECLVLSRLTPYICLITIILGIIVIVRWARLSVLQYLFLTSMRAGVPLLIVNIISLILSLLLGAWVVSALFGVNLAPLLATSAVLSIILGIALQDSLGNLFAGLALQFERTYAIGDWIEVQLPTHKCIGKVDEITWRATVLIGWTDEQITIPNRVMGQSQIANFSIRQAPFYKSLVFRLDYASQIEEAKRLLLHAASQIPQIAKSPQPLCLLSESNESWVSVKLIYCIEDYGKQLVIADELMSKGLQLLRQAGIELAKDKIELFQANS